MPRLTVMMAARNVEPYIERAITSTMTAMPRDARLFVLSDGSTDATVERVSRHAGPRLEFEHSSQNVGSGAARAEILRRTDSEFVANMDADDICFPWRFAMQLRHIQAVDVSFMSHASFGQDFAHWLPGAPWGYSPSDSRIGLVFHNPFAHSTLLARRDSLESVGGYGQIRYAQDYHLLLRLAAAGQRLGRLRAYGIALRQSPGQISRQADYNARIRSQTPLRDSYLALASTLSPTLRRHLADPGKAPADERIGRELLLQLRGLHWTVAPRYRLLLRRGGLGPMWGCWTD